MGRSAPKAESQGPISANAMTSHSCSFHSRGFVRRAARSLAASAVDAGNKLFLIGAGQSIRSLEQAKLLDCPCEASMRYASTRLNGPDIQRCDHIAWEYASLWKDARHRKQSTAK